MTKSLISFRFLSVTVMMAAMVLPHGAEAARPDYATIELRGSKSAHVDVRFEEPIRIVCCTDSDSPGQEQPSVRTLTARTDGAFAGYAVERLSDGKMVAGGVRVPAMDWDDEEGNFEFRWIVRLKRGGALLAPGLYRIHLLTDTESTVRFRVYGLDQDESYQPKSPTTVTSSFKTPLLEPAEPVSHHTTPVQVGEDTWVAIASLLVAERNQVSYLEHCVVLVIEPCQSRDDYSGAAHLEPVSNIWSLYGIYSVYRPGHFEPGEWQAQFSAASAGLVQKAQTLVLTIDLPGRDTAAGGADGGKPGSGSDSGEDPDESTPPPGSENRDSSDGDGSDGASRMPSGSGSVRSSTIDQTSGSSLPFSGTYAGLYIVLAFTLLAAGALLIALDAPGRSRRNALAGRLDHVVSDSA